MDTFNIQNWKREKTLELLSENSLKGTNAELMKHLRSAVEVATQSHKQAQINPGEAEPGFGQDVAEMLKKVYNAISTGNENNSLYADEVFK